MREDETNRRSTNEADTIDASSYQVWYELVPQIYSCQSSDLHFDPKIASEQILEHPILNIFQGEACPQIPLIAAAWLQLYACLNLKCLLLPMFKVIVTT